MSSTKTSDSRAYFTSSISEFVDADPLKVLGVLASQSEFDVTGEQRSAWEAQISILRDALMSHPEGLIAFEFIIPRLGRRIDVLLLIEHLLFVIEFKVGSDQTSSSARDQVWDYALDLKNFHRTSHDVPIVPLLVSTERKTGPYMARFKAYKDGVFYPEEPPVNALADVIAGYLERTSGTPVDKVSWITGAYQPTPTIVEAAKALYASHSIKELSRSDANAKNLAETSTFISDVIREARAKHQKVLCLVSGVPGAGKTLVGLDVATRHMDAEADLHSVFLSGNGPLVRVLREALTRDRVQREAVKGHKVRKGEARSDVETFIQNVHHFRDECLKTDDPPVEHVAIFDEAQRAWNVKQTSSFMNKKKGLVNFKLSEPEFLISCLDRHTDWAVIVCLIGGGQEINTGEAGVLEWIAAIERSYPDWHVRASTRLHDSEYGAGEAVRKLGSRARATFSDNLHLSVSMRSFRAENLSELIKSLLDADIAKSRESFRQLQSTYPIRLTRDLASAKKWLRTQARGTERYGIVVSSQAQRLRPLAIDVRASTDPIHWFLDSREDVRSSFYLEDVATEFDVQGLELDWTCLVWDADLRFTGTEWSYHSFVGTRWNRIKTFDRQLFLKNAYRVLLTRARQGMVIVVPEGSDDDPSRTAAYYDGTHGFLRSLGLPELSS